MIQFYHRFILKYNVIMKKKLSIAFLWHMHQPLYKDINENGIYYMPWVRLHAVKDYLDMLLIADKYDKIKLNFNFVPVLLDALIDYTDSNTHDIHSKLTVTDVHELTFDDKVYILNNFFDANYRHMIKHHAYYETLYKKRLTIEDTNVECFSDQEYSDIMALFNISWMDPCWKEIYPEIKTLTEKEKNYTLDDRQRIIEIQRDIIRNIIPQYKEHQQRGKIELQTSPYYHPILPLLLNMKDAKASATRYPLPKGDFNMKDDAYKQTVNALDRMEELFGKRPKGIWPSEHCISKDTLDCLIKAGVNWTLSDEGVLSSSLKKEFIRDHRGSIIDPYDVTQVYNYKNTKGDINLVFRNSVIPNLISFEYPLHETKDSLNDIYDRIKTIQSKLENSPSDNHLLLIAMDGENSWESFENDGIDFLNGLYSKINEDTSLDCVLLSDYIENNQKTQLNKITPGSWINHNFQLWIAEPTKNLAWEYLNNTCNDLYKFERQGVFSQEQLKQAREELQIAQGSDWFWWYGEPNDSGQDNIFDYLFRQHLMNVYRALYMDYPEYLNTSLISSIGKPSRNQKSLITPNIYDTSNDNVWQNAGFIEIPSRPIMEDKRILNKIFFGCDSDKMYFKFDLNNFLLSECGNDFSLNNQFKIFIYYKKEAELLTDNVLNQSSVRTLISNDDIYPTLKEKYTNEVQITFKDRNCVSIQLSQAISNNLWAYSLSNNVEYNFDNNLYISIPFDDLSITKGEKVEFCFITSICDKTEEVCPQDLLLSLIRPDNKKSIIDELNYNESLSV